MWRWRHEHVIAWAICVAAIAAPRSLWDRIRLPLVAAADAATARLGAEAPAGPAAEIGALRAELARTEAARAELERLLAQAAALTRAAPRLKVGMVLPIRVFGAEAAASGASARAGRVRLDAGERSGLVAPAPVVEGAALVGRLVAVSEDAAEAELVTATTFRVRARNVRTGVEGIGRGAGGREIRFRPDGAEPDLAPGDSIVTSAFSSYAPGGLALGTVAAIDRDPETGLVEAVLRPAADLAGLERALVLVGWESAR